MDITAIIGIILGGGVIGQLIIFYTKRHDERKQRRNTILVNFITCINAAEEIINNILLKSTEAQKQINIRLTQEAVFLDSVYEQNKKLHADLKYLYETEAPQLAPNELSDKEQVIFNRYPYAEIDIANKRIDLEKSLNNIYQTIITQQNAVLKQLNLFPRESSELFQLRRPIRVRLLQLANEYQRQYIRITTLVANEPADQLNATIARFISLLEILEQIKYTTANFTKD